MLFWQKCWRQRQSMFLPWPPWATRQKIETILSYVPPPKMAKANTVFCCCCWHYCAYFANGNKAFRRRRSHNAATLLRCGSRLDWNIRLRWECLAGQTLQLFTRPGCEILIEKIFLELKLGKNIFWSSDFFFSRIWKGSKLNLSLTKCEKLKTGNQRFKTFSPVIVAQSK